MLDATFSPKKVPIPEQPRAAPLTTPAAPLVTPATPPATPPTPPNEEKMDLSTSSVDEDSDTPDYVPPHSEDERVTAAAAEGECVKCAHVTTDKCPKCGVFAHDFCKHDWYVLT